MAGRRIVYGLVLVVLFATLTLYDFSGLRLLFGFLLLLPVMGMVQLLYSIWLVKGSFQRSSYRCVRGEAAGVGILLWNKGWLPLSRVCIQAMGQKLTILGVDGRERRHIDISYHTEHCGRMSFQIGQVKIYDYLGLCVLGKRMGRRDRTGLWTSELYVLPRAEELDGDRLLEAIRVMQSMQQGMEENETYEYRDYREGDSLHRVHWKLSARMEELQIRETDGQMQKGILLLWRGCAEGAGKEQRVEWDAYLDRSLALMELFYREHYLESVCWYEDGQLVIREIKNEEDIQETMLQLLTPPKGAMLPVEPWREPDWLYLNRERKLYCGDRCLYE